MARAMQPPAVDPAVAQPRELMRTEALRRPRSTIDPGEQDHGAACRDLQKPGLPQRRGGGHGLPRGILG